MERHGAAAEVGARAEPPGVGVERDTARVVELDLLRTFPEHPAFCAAGAPPTAPPAHGHVYPARSHACLACGQLFIAPLHSWHCIALGNLPLPHAPGAPLVAPLRRVLLAHAAHSPHVGYCQGLNLLAAVRNTAAARM